MGERKERRENTKLGNCIKEGFAEEKHSKIILILLNKLNLPKDNSEILKSSIPFSHYVTALLNLVWDNWK